MLHSRDKFECNEKLSHVAPFRKLVVATLQLDGVCEEIGQLPLSYNLGFSSVRPDSGTPVVIIRTGHRVG